MHKFGCWIPRQKCKSLGAGSPEGNAQVWVLDPTPTEMQKVWGLDPPREMRNFGGSPTVRAFVQLP